MADVLLGLGSNLGDREENIRKAIMLLQERTEVLAISSIYESEPMYHEDQPWFINCAAKAETELSPREMLSRLKEVERRMGRTNEIRYGPRIIDIDILFYGSQVIGEEGLTIPHPKIPERAFVLIPLAEIEPNFLHPVLRKTISELLAALHTEKVVKKVPSDTFPQLGGTASGFT